jgi:hypothetical protein
MNIAAARKLTALAAVTVLAGTMLAPTAEAGIVYSTSCSAMPLMSTSKAMRVDQMCAGICLNNTCGKVNIDCFNECIDMADQPEGVCYNHGSACADGAPIACGGAVCAATEQECRIMVRQMLAVNIDAYSLPSCSTF